MLFKDDVCSIYHPQKGKIAQSIMSANRRFILRIEPSTTTNEGRCLQVSNTDESTLWHHHYGHLVQKGLCTLKQKNKACAPSLWSSRLERLVHLETQKQGMSHIVAPNTTYEACVKGKQHWTPFSEIGKWRETEKLGLVHADLFGPISPVRVTRKSTCCALSMIFQESHGVIFWQKEIGMPIKCLRTNKGGQFSHVSKQ